MLLLTIIKTPVTIKIASRDEGRGRLLASSLSKEQLNKPKEIWDPFDAELDAYLKIYFLVRRLEFSCMHQQID